MTEPQRSAGRPTFGLLVTTAADAQALVRPLHSLLSQAGDFELRLHVQHLEASGSAGPYLRSVAEQIERGHWPAACCAVDFGYSVDGGGNPLRAAARGLATLLADAGEMVAAAWLPSPASLPAGALSALASFYRRRPEVQWLAGRAVVGAGDLAEGHVLRVAQVHSPGDLANAAGARLLDALQIPATWCSPALWRSLGPLFGLAEAEGMSVCWRRAAAMGLALVQLDADLSNLGAGVPSWVGTAADGR